MKTSPRDEFANDFDDSADVSMDLPRGILDDDDTNVNPYGKRDNKMQHDEQQYPYTKASRY